MATLVAPTVAVRETTNRTGPVDQAVPTEDLLYQRNCLPPGHPDRTRLRDQAIEQNLPMASRMARRYAGRGELLDDLAQVAAIALINAVDRFDPTRQVPFAGFAIPSMHGALKRHFRDSAWAMKVPRPIQDLALRIPAATNELGHQRGGTATTAELASHLAVTVNDLRAAASARQSYRLRSLSAPDPITGADFMDVSGGLDRRYADIDDRMTLDPLVAELPSREQLILAMRFHRHMSQTQIAAEIGLSQMHVSRLLKQSLTRLRAALSA